MGGARNTEREAQVRALVAIAQKYEVPCLPAAKAANASRQKVCELIDALKELELSRNEKSSLERAAVAYQATFPNLQQVSDNAEQATWKFQAVQLTYNARTAEWSSTDKTLLKILFDRFTVFVQSVAAELSARGASTTMERGSLSPDHVHCHAYLHLAKPFHRRGASALDIFNFEGVRPHVEPNTASGKAFAGAVRYGHFYVVVPKIGSLFDHTTFPPFAAYAVEGWWLDSLLKAGKLTRETYLSLAARVTVGFQKRLADVRVAERYEKDCALELAVRADAAALQELKWPMRNFPEVEAFLNCHTGAPAFRRPILAIVGGTRLGKSMLANDVLQRLADRLGLHGYIEVTVEDSEAMDLADFDRRLHSGVLLDGVGDALFLKRNREALQGRPKIVKGARSATNVYSYSYSFCGRAVVATFDLSASNLDALRCDHWLSNRENLILLWLEAPAFLPDQDVSQIDLPNTPDQPGRKRRWIASPVARQLVFEDGL
ncbi:unnamed protein product [Effrenium voratum]|nr:unnamed protein product [Effrenium voratum]